MTRRHQAAGVARAALRRVRSRPPALLRPVREVWRASHDRSLLVPDPVFLLSSVRSGSTLLRMMLDTHSAIVAPHEMHLGSVRVKLAHEESRAALDLLGLNERALENMLWDRIFAQLLATSGKSVVVDKTPNNTLHWGRVARYWPDARYLFLLRHPVHVATSLIASRADCTVEEHHARADRYSRALHDARTALPGLTVRYEDLTADPPGQTQRICSWLGLDWEPGMLDYRAKRAPIRRGLGDWSPTLKSGAIRPPQPAPTPEQVPAALREVTELLGYL